MRPFRRAKMGCLSLALMVGCTQNNSGNAENDPAVRLPALHALGVNHGDAVVARGKLEPAGGVVAITAPLGNRLLRLDVAEGDRVDQGATLGELNTLRARHIEKSVAEAQLAEAESNIKAKEEVAIANLEVARVRLEQAKLMVAQAEAELEQANQPKGRMGLLDHEVQLATDKLKRLREAADDPDTKKLVNQSTLDQHQLSLDQSQSQLNAARVTAKQKIESGKLAIKAAEKEFKAAEVAIESGRASASLDSLQRKLELLDLQIKASELVSPLEGRVVSVNIRPGEATAGLPIMHIADTSEMICRAEINVADLPRIKVGSPAKVSSLALPRVLSGKVKSISRMIGSPRLPTANPLARVDWRSAEVMISIDGKDNQAAVNLINLQVDVAIQAEPRVDIGQDSHAKKVPQDVSAGDAADADGPK
jgi:HlyD family secretion protein